MVLSYLGRTLKLYTLQMLFTIVAMLSGSRLQGDVSEDTAFLSEDRRSISVGFVLHGVHHKVDLPYNPYSIESLEFKVYNGEDKLLGMHYTTCPGLQDFLFHPEALNHIYGGVVKRIVVEDNVY
jgi:hypothetical protein